MKPDSTESILNLIDKETAFSVRELSEQTGFTDREIQEGLSYLMDRGMITSTPEWKYRRSRRVE